jgi:mono/diheme cytochrome c family protein/uncharacterized membrane protein
MTILERVLPGIAAYPDVHPMIVHFPSALFPTAMVFALLAVWRYPDQIRTSRSLVLLGTVAGIVAAATGLRAEDMMSHGPGTIVAVHKTFMLTTMALAIVLSVFVLLQWWTHSIRARWVHIAALGIVNLVLVLGADRGALVSMRLRSGRDLSLPRASSPPTPSPTAAESDTSRGHELYAVLRCDQCHGHDRKIEAPGIPPSLEDAGSRMQTEWLSTYLARPHRIRWVDEDVRPVIRMPDFELEEDEARDIAGYLSTLQRPDRFPSSPVASSPLGPEEAIAGRTLVGDYTCKGCHMIGGSGNTIGPALDAVGLRLTAPYIYAFIRDPKGIIPRTSMKNFDLTPVESRAITAYLMTLRQPEAASPSSSPEPETRAQP